MNEYQRLIDTLISVINLKQSQEDFFCTLAYIQERSVYFSLEKYNKSKNKDIETTLFDVTSEVIYSIMELIDGYIDTIHNFDIIDMATKQSIKGNLELHDVIIDYLKN